MKDQDRYFEDSFYTYLEHQVMKYPSHEMKSFQYLPATDHSEELTIVYLSIYLDPTLNTYVRVKSGVLCDTLLNEDEVEYVAIQACHVPMFSVRQKRVNRVECYIPNKMMLMHEVLLGKGVVFRVYIVNLYKDEDGGFRLDADEFYKSTMIK